MSQLKQITINPTKIHLKELPPEGKIYSYSNESGELTLVLKDLIGSNNYFMKVEIKPMGNAYEMRGELKTDLKLVCSLCAIDFNFALDESFHEILMLEKTRPRTGKSSKINHLTDMELSSPFCNYLESDVFDIGEFAHELIALAEPMRPTAQPDCDKSCKNYQKSLLSEGWLKTDSDQECRARMNPFSVLKNWPN